jgi:hypothetical protein
VKNVFLLMVVSALLVTLGFAQTPDAGSNTSVANVSGCLGGSDGAYTVMQDGTDQLFKISTSSVALKAHLGHDVKLTGQKSSAAAGNSLAVTELSMISDHCAAAAAAPAATVAPSPETVIPPDAATAPPSAASAAAAAAPAVPADPAAPVASAPPVDSSTPSSAVTPTPSTPAVDSAAPAPGPSAPTAPAVEVTPPAAPTAPPAATTSAPAVEAAHAPRPSIHAHKVAATQPAVANTEAGADATVSPSPADAATPAAAVRPIADTASVPAAAAPDTAAPAPVVTHRAGSLTILVSFVVLVIVLGTTAPLIGRWRKRKMLERDGSPNLSFTNDTNEDNTTPASSDQDKPDSRKVA